MRSERSQTPQRTYCMILLYEVSRINKSSESRSVVAGGCGEGKWGMIAYEYGVSFWGEENVLELDGEGSGTKL